MGQNSRLREDMRDLGGASWMAGVGRTVFFPGQETGGLGCIGGEKDGLWGPDQAEHRSCPKGKARRI